jgi:tripartite-type tricarboxylate transporter receptor subunit TctC
VDLVEGRIQLQFGLVNASVTAVREGKLRALAVTTAQRFPDLPDVPTMAEAAVPGYEASLWMAIVMPAGVPPAIADRMHAELNAIIQTTEVRKGFTTISMIAESSTPQHVEARIKSDIEKWRAIALQANVQAQ